MKTSHIAIILGIVITSSVIFGVTFKMPLDDSAQISFESPLREEYYEIQITGMKDVYLVGEQYDFSYIISGYGYSCGSKEITFPDQNGDTMRTISSSSCIAGVPMKEFVIDSKKEYDTTSVHGKIKNPGLYAVAIEFEQSDNFEPTQSGHQFYVVEKICDDSNTKDKVHCFSDSFDSCTSAYIKTDFPTGEGDPIYVIGVVESWNDCKLRVYLDTTQDRYGGHSTGVLRSICEDVIVKNDYWTITNCNNFDVPPKMKY